MGVTFDFVGIIVGIENLIKKINYLKSIVYNQCAKFITKKDVLSTFLHLHIIKFMTTLKALWSHLSFTTYLK